MVNKTFKYIKYYIKKQQHNNYSIIIISSITY